MDNANVEKLHEKHHRSSQGRIKTYLITGKTKMIEKKLGKKQRMQEVKFFVVDFTYVRNRRLRLETLDYSGYNEKPHPIDEMELTFSSNNKAFTNFIAKLKS